MRSTLMLFLLAGVAFAGETRKIDATEVAAAHARAAREAARIVRFESLHAVRDDDPHPEPAPAATVPLAVALETVAGLAKGLDYSGHGDVDYWFRAATDLARSGRAIGAAVSAVGRAMPDDATGRLVLAQGKQLAAMQAAGTGDVDYWLATTKGLGDQLASAGGLLAQLSTASAASNQGVNIKVVVDGLVTVARSVNASGTGNDYFWMRATEHNAQVSRAVGKQLKVVSAATTPDFGPALAAISGLFSAVSAGGSGTVDYWLARATATARQVRAHADTLAGLVAPVAP